MYIRCVVSNCPENKITFVFQNPHCVMRGAVFTVGRRGCDLSIKDQSIPSVLCELSQSEVFKLLSDWLSFLLA